MNKLLDNFTIKQKLIAMSAVSIIGVLAMIWLKTSFNQEFELMKAAKYTNLEINNQMLELRKHEKDFLVRKDTKYIDKFKKSFTELKNSVNKLSALTEEIEYPATQATQRLNAVFDEYQKVFLQLSTRYQELGLTPTTGLYGSLREAVHKAEENVNSHNKIDLLADILMLRRHEKDFMLRQDEKYIQRFAISMDKINAYVKESDLSDNQKAELAKNLKNYANDFKTFSNKLITIGLNAELGDLGLMRTTIHKSQTLLDEQSEALTTYINAEVEHINQIYIILAATIVIIMCWLIFVAYKGINTPLQSLTHTMNKANREKDLSIRSNMTGKHEIAQLALVFDNMMESFSQVLAHIDQASEQVSSASSELSQINQVSASNIREQQSLIEQVATAMNEMTVSVQEVSRNISATSESADDAYQETNTGKEKVSSAVSSVEALVDKIVKAKNVLDQLDKDSDDVSKVMEVIRGVAEQTNLLALNAAIEAARAGEQGRGFAVVADEVRTLAGRTQQSTEEINQIIERLQANSKLAVEVMEQSQSQVTQTVEQAQTAGIALNVVTEKVNQINSMSTQIACAAEEQNSVAEDINQKIVEINDRAISNTENSEQSSIASNEQARLAGELKQLVNQFKH